ncbi:sulfatase-like hydrolase/transferase [Selenomonas sp. FC4001]|uniref:sulfatase-like hydrolase/transferase n=1 Tax=Selenomonas sp. FC4001 TaxID=1408313 RepID=UPI00056D6AE2|nr:sulfatase-like hydrolase/transferase [Selenomonas sp. FC4001]
MPKNLILIHLESLNNVTFEHLREELSNISGLLRSAILYKKYYSSATSTYMVMSDLFLGTNKAFEKCKKLKEIFSTPVIEHDLFSDLRSSGYATKIYSADVVGGAEEYVNVYAPNSDKYIISGTSELLVDDIESYITQKSKFAIFLANLESHLEGYNHLSVDSTDNQCDIFIKRFKKLDEFIGQIMTMLRDSKKDSNTTVVLYGDHGDDYWGHGIHDGYTHAIEPFPFLINCPLVIWNVEQQGTISYELISTIDLKNIIKQELGLVSPCAVAREYIYSRNLFSGQDTKPEAFNKSYMVSDGTYSLMVSTRGVRLYCSAIDPLNARNLLDFFKLESGSLHFNSVFYELKSTHFSSVFNEDIIEEITKYYYKLRGALFEEVIRLYGGCKPTDLDFESIDYGFFSADKQLIGILNKRRPSTTFRIIVKKILGDYGTKLVKKYLNK